MSEASQSWDTTSSHLNHPARFSVGVGVGIGQGRTSNKRQWRIGSKSMYSGARLLGFKSQVCYSVAVLPWSSYLPSLCLCFLTSKVGIVSVAM